MGVTDPKFDIAWIKRRPAERELGLVDIGRTVGRDRTIIDPRLMYSERRRGIEMRSVVNAHNSQRRCQ